MLTAMSHLASVDGEAALHRHVPDEPDAPAGEQPPPTPGPEPQQVTAEEFDPGADCPLDCPRRNPSLSFGQVQALAATFPAYI